MLPAAANAPTPEPSPVPAPDQLLWAWRDRQRDSGRGNPASDWAARAFLDRWPNPQAWADQPLGARLVLAPSTMSLLMFLMAHRMAAAGLGLAGVTQAVELLARGLRLAARGRHGPVLRHGGGGRVQRDSGETGRVAVGRPAVDPDRPPTRAVGHRRPGSARRRVPGPRGRDRATLAALPDRARVRPHGAVPPRHRPPTTRAPQQPDTFEARLADCRPNLRPAMAAYLERKRGTCRPKTVSSLATRLAHFGRFLAEHDPELESLAGLGRQRHIEPYLSAVANAASSKTGRAITVADQDRRIRAVGHMLAEITEWGWDDAPARKLIFRSDHPRQPRPLPRYLPVDADRRLTEALEASTYRLAADALLLARAVGLRIGELLDLELDCVHEIGGHGAWLKVPLGKLDTERMVPLDDETVALIDRITATRSTGQPLPHPRTGGATQFLFTHHGRRLSQTAVRTELARSADTAGIGHVTPHQLRHTYATALVNAGVSLQALMALLGHASAEMSLRYAHLFDATVRAEYERALDLAKGRIGAMPTPTGRPRIPVTANGGCTSDDDWRDAPAIKARLAGGHCLRAPAQGACPYANICEHCPSFRTDAASAAVLSAQRVDTRTLLADAQTRGWIDEADRHRRLLDRLDTLIANTA